MVKPNVNVLYTYSTDNHLSQYAYSTDFLACLNRGSTSVNNINDGSGQKYTESGKVASKQHLLHSAAGGQIHWAVNPRF